ncbi:MAG: hypothetical protein GWP41_04710, partial [Planctomycetia bacterium]|nr:hypothetical protein [Planctomycetia bacterium]
LSLKAGGSGLNLTASSYVVLYDPWWNPAVENRGGELPFNHGVILRIGPDMQAKRMQVLQSPGVAWDDLPPLRFEGALAGKGVEAKAMVRAEGPGEVISTHQFWQTCREANALSSVLHHGKSYVAYDQGGFFCYLNTSNGEIMFQERLQRRFGAVYRWAANSTCSRAKRLRLLSKRAMPTTLDAYNVIEEIPPLAPRLVNAHPAVVGNGLLIRSTISWHLRGDRKSVSWKGE